jgi:hypothetical protein
VGKRVRPKRTDTFETEVGKRFGPVAQRWGLEGPVADGVVLPTLTYRLDRLTYLWMLDPQDGQLSVAVHLVVAGGTLGSYVADIVVGAGLGRAQQVRQGARTWLALTQAIDSHVEWLQRLHPTLTGPGSEEFLERAGARKSTPDLE